MLGPNCEFVSVQNRRDLSPSDDALGPEQPRERMDGNPWIAAGESLIWNPHAGVNRVEARTVNRFGGEGPISKVEIEQ